MSHHPPGWRLRARSSLTAAVGVTVLALLLTACLSSTPLEDLDGTLSRAYAVNDHGVIVGRHLDGNQNVGFLFDPDSGVVSSIPSLNNGSGEATDVNDHGLVVGNSFFDLVDCLIPVPGLCPIPVDHAFLYDSNTGTLEDLADFGVGVLPPGANELAVGSDASGVNEAGVVVGTAISIGPPTVPGAQLSVYPRAFAFDSVSRTVTDLSVYGMTTAADIDENGLVLGQIDQHAAVLDLETGAVTEIGTFGGTVSQGYAMNDEGLVVGTAQVAGNIASHVFVYDLATGASTDIGTLPASGAPNSTAYGVSNDGIVVGTSAASGEQHPFAYDVPAKSMKDLGVLGTSNFVEARDVNDAGVVVGFSQVPPTHAWRARVWRHY